MHNCKLLIFFSDELKTIQCRSENPASFILKIADFDPVILEDSLYLRLEWHEDNRHWLAPVEFVSCDSSEITLKPAGETRSHDKEQFHIVEMNEFILITRVSDSEVMDYKAKADYINKKFRNSLAEQIKRFLIEETLTNQLIFKMLLQIDAKLDDMNKEKERGDDDREYHSTRMLSMSGGGACFIADDADVGDVFFIKSDSKYNTGFTYAALCKVHSVIRTGSKCICETEFVHIDETTRDGIIRMVFEKDREKLKRKSI